MYAAVLNRVHNANLLKSVQKEEQVRLQRPHQTVRVAPPRLQARLSARQPQPSAPSRGGRAA